MKGNTMTTTFPTLTRPVGFDGQAELPAYWNTHDLPAGHDDPNSLYFVPVEYREDYPPEHYRAAHAWNQSTLREPRWNLAKDLVRAGLVLEGSLNKAELLIPYDMHLDALAGCRRRQDERDKADRAKNPPRCPVCGLPVNNRTGSVQYRDAAGRLGSSSPGDLLSCELCWKASAWVREQAHLYEAGEDGRSRLESVCAALGIRVNLATAPTDELASRRARRARRDKNN